MVKFPTKEQFGHYGGGVLVAYFSFVAPVLAVLITTLFALYEMDEQWRITDEAFKDIREFLIGLFVGALLSILYPLLRF